MPKKNFYTVMKEMDWSPHKGDQPGTIYELFGWKKDSKNASSLQARVALDKERKRKLKEEARKRAESNE